MTPPDAAAWVRHVKRGTAYEVLGLATLQTEKPLNDFALVRVYRGADGMLWARADAEFRDGRFMPCEPPQPQPVAFDRETRERLVNDAIKLEAHGKPAAHRIRAALAHIDRIEAQVVDLKTSVVAFGAPWAVQYAKDFGLPPGHLHATHYDILAGAGARMDSFVRAPAPAAEVAG